MNPSIICASPGITLPEVSSGTQQAAETADLLRQLLDVQREQLALSRAIAMNNDPVLRWRRFLEKWNIEFPDIAHTCKTVLPTIERVYLSMMTELTERLQNEDDDFDSEFVLGEFLDKYGMRLNQLSTIIGQIRPWRTPPSLRSPSPRTKTQTTKAPRVERRGSHAE